MITTRSTHASRAVGLVLACLATLAAACGDEAESTTTTSTPTTSTPTTSAPVPSLSDRDEVRLQARAMVRAWQERASSQMPVCTSSEASADLRAALSEIFPAEIEYVSPEELMGMNSGDFRCVVVNGSGTVEWLLSDVVGVEAGVMLAPLNGSGGVYQFRWNGSEWVETTPEDTGVTVTSWVS